MVRSPSSRWSWAPESASRRPASAIMSRLQCRSVVSTAVVRPYSATACAPVGSAGVADSWGGAPGEAPGDALDEGPGPVGAPGDAPGEGDGLAVAAPVRAATASACSRTAAVSTAPDAAVTSTTPPTSWEACQAAARFASTCA